MEVCMKQFSAVPGVAWPAVDGLGRAVPVQNEARVLRKEKFTGIFYFLTHLKEAGANGPYDVTKILLEQRENPLGDESIWGPPWSSHHWGEPLFGYYLVDDPWVLRKHCHLLADAGIDTLIFDTTNAVTYPEAYMKLCEVFEDVRKAGECTPQIAFMTNTKAGETALEIYNNLYKPGLYKDLWFQWKGKPLLLAPPEEVTQELRDFFTLRKAYWPFVMQNTHNAWHWEAAYPQPYSYEDNEKVAEQVVVSVAQNLTIKVPTNASSMSRGDCRGRSFHHGKEHAPLLPPYPEIINYGMNAEEQWSRALELDPEFLFVTGWNEWTAGRGKEEVIPDRPVQFMDQFSQEYSRDTEPMKGGHADNYYYQMVSGVRKFKGVQDLPVPEKPKTIDIKGVFDQWDAVQPEFLNHDMGNVRRDHSGYGNLRYKNDTLRNNILRAKVSFDKENIYFYAETKNDISPPGNNWMWLLISSKLKAESSKLKNHSQASTQNDGRDLRPAQTSGRGLRQVQGKGWEGYDFIINRLPLDGNNAVLEKSEKGWNWKKAGTVNFKFQGNKMHLAVPRKILGLATDPLIFDFKWADNIQKPGDIMDFYVSGDVAPAGRFRYRFQSESG